MKLSTLSKTRKNMNSRLVRQSGAIVDLMYSSKNYVIVGKTLAKFDYIFKQLLLVHQEYHSLLEDDKKLADEKSIEEVHEHVFTFKHKAYNCMAVLMAEAGFRQQRQMTENRAEQLRVKDKMAK